MARILFALALGVVWFSFSSPLRAQNFRVQVAAYTDSVPAAYFTDKGVNGVVASVDDSGIYRYIFGSYATYLEAEEVQQRMVAKGFAYAAVIDLEAQRVLTNLGACSYYKGGPVPIAENDSIRFMYFGLGQSALPEKEKADLDHMLAKLKATPASQLRILGYTDAVGGGAANLELATARARAARNYLIDRGIDPNRMLLRVFGEALAGRVEEEVENAAELEEIRKLYRCVVLVWRPE
ncbi:MAG: OmpA family protein [Saprospiraceae bacterium]|nr:OmpA family protein [Saprospiraceae bacterium]